jgi:hypothetical protein
MSTPLNGASLASLPRDSLAALAEVRDTPGVKVTFVGAFAWVSWTASNEAILRCLLPIRGACFYQMRDGIWHRPGCRLPSFNVPDLTLTQSLAQALTPAPVRPRLPDNASRQPLTLRLVRDNRPRGATALSGTSVDVARWADTATTAALASVRAAISGRLVLLVGRRLPGLPGAERFWGERVLVPLGFRPEPCWPESALVEALGLADDEMAILRESGATVVPGAALRPLTRASARLAARELTS